MKLQTLKPRLATIATTRLKPAERLRGRAAVERRRQFLYSNPLCAECGRQGRVTAATVPDHITALVNGGDDTEENLQALCDECHRVKTAKDLGHRVKPTIGVDGWPE